MEATASSEPSLLNTTYAGPSAFRSNVGNVDYECSVDGGRFPRLLRRHRLPIDSGPSDSVTRTAAFAFASPSADVGRSS